MGMAGFLELKTLIKKCSGKKYIEDPVCLGTSVHGIMKSNQMIFTCQTERVSIKFFTSGNCDGKPNIYN